MRMLTDPQTSARRAPVFLQVPYNIELQQRAGIDRKAAIGER
jgi:hypothetical protein